MDTAQETLVLRLRRPLNTAIAAFVFGLVTVLLVAHI
jgi:hypothetical protein